MYVTKAYAPPYGRTGTILEGIASGRCPKHGQPITIMSMALPSRQVHFVGLNHINRHEPSPLVSITVAETLDPNDCHRASLGEWQMSATQPAFTVNVEGHQPREFDGRGAWLRASLYYLRCLVTRA